MSHGTSGSLPKDWDLSYYSGAKNGEVTTVRSSSGREYQQQTIWNNDLIIITQVFDKPGWFETHTIREIKVVDLNLNGDIVDTENSYAKQYIRVKYDPDHINKADGYYLIPGDPNSYIPATEETIAIETGTNRIYEQSTQYPHIDTENHITSQHDYTNCEKCSKPAFETQPLNREAFLNTTETDQFFAEGWWKKPFSLTKNSIDQELENDTNTASAISKPAKFNKRSTDKLTNFNPSTDTLEIDTDGFGIDRSATFTAGKNKKAVKKKLAKQDIDFLYDQKKGGLYFNENGADKGFGDGGIIAILKGAPELNASNLEFI